MKNNIITHDPFGLINPFLDEFFTGESNSRFYNLMNTDILDCGDTYEFKIEVPDIKKENIHLSLEDGYLTVEAEVNKSNDEKEKGRYIRKERYYGSTKREFYVGDDLTEEDIKASLNDGVLTLVVNKKEEKKNEKKYIDID